MELRVLGSLEIVADGRTVAITSERQRALLALLLVHVGQPVSTERIIDALWGDEPPDDGAGTVAFHVSRLRAMVEPSRRGTKPGTAGVIATTAGGYALRVPPDSIDAIRSERLVREGRERLDGDPAAASERLTQALALWRGEPFADIPDMPFLQPEIDRLNELRLRALEDRFEADLRLGRGPDIVGEVERLVAEEPLREHLRALLIRALYGAGRQADALLVYREGRRVLSEELGIDPSPELQSLELAVLRQDPRLEVGRPAARPRNPYKGLRPFGEADAEDFHGRDALVERLIQRLLAVSRADGLLLVVGPSGCGKSSVVRAGLLPRLRSPGSHGDVAWRIATVLPGSRPIEALHRALGIDTSDRGREARPTSDPSSVAAAVRHAAAAEPRPLLIVIDQLEEIFTLPTDARVAPGFLQGIADALHADGPRPVVVAALRTDCLDRALAHPSFGQLVHDATEIVAPMTRDELARAIERPASAVGVELEPGLTTRLEADVLGRPGALPLLQFALTELVERTSEHRLTGDSYAAIGGIAGAVGRRAEMVFASLDEGSQALAQQLFLRLVSVGEGRSASARRTRVDELRSLDPVASRVDTVLEAFGRWRLLSFDRDPRTGSPTVEPAHEALLTHWARLAEWVRQAEDGLWIASRLKDAASEWSDAERDPGFLLTGGRLDLFASWAATTDLRLDQTERAFLDESLAERQRLEAGERERAERQRRLERRAANGLRALVAVFAMAALLSSALLALVLRQNEVADEERATASARELAVAANGQLDADPSLAILLAVESARATSGRGWITEETLDALHWALQEARIAYPTQDAPSAVRHAPDGPRGVYLLPAEELVELARAGAGRSLTSAECRTYLHEEACPTGAPPPPSGGLAVMTTDGPAPVDRIATSGVSGTVVRVWSQLPVDLATALAPYAAESGAGIAISFDDAMSPPWPAIERADVAILARPGDVADLSRQGSLLELRDIVGAAASDQLRQMPVAEVGWLEPPEAGADADRARHVGVPIAVTASSLLWYPADAFASSGYEPPGSWSELDDLLGRLASDGRTPWCLGLVGGEHDGASAADWVEDLVIDQLAASPSGLDQARWPRFGHPSVKSAVLRLHGLLNAEGAVLGGPGSAARTPSEWAAAQMGTGTEPRCWLVHGGVDERARWIGPLRSDLTPLLLPLGDPHEMAVRGRVYTLVVMRDRPEVRALVRHVLGSGLGPSLRIADSAAGALALTPGPSAPFSSEGEEPLSAALAAAISSGRFWPDASDQMTRPLGVSAFPEAVLRIVESHAVTAEAVAETELGSLARTVPAVPS